MFAFAGEVLAVVVPLPVAGPIYGIVLLLFALIFGMPIKYVDGVADFILGFLGLFFIAPAVGILEIFDSIRPIWPMLAVILISAYLISMLVTGTIAEIMLKNNPPTPRLRRTRAKKK